MSTIYDVRRRLKEPPQDLLLMVMIDGQYYEVDVNKIRSVYVKPELDFEGIECYGIADRDHKESFQVLAIE